MKRPAHIPWPKDEDGNPLDTPDKRAKYLERINLRLAEEFEGGEKDVTGTADENLRWQRTLWKTAHKYKTAFHADATTRGALKGNRDKIDRANDLSFEIAQIWRPGMSASQVQDRLRQENGEAPTLRTIQRHIKKTNEP